MRRYADRVQLIHQIFADAVVEDALAVERRLFGGVEGRGVVLEILDNRAGLRTLVGDVGLSFVNLPAAFHGTSFRARSAAQNAKTGLGPVWEPNLTMGGALRNNSSGQQRRMGRSR